MIDGFCATPQGPGPINRAAGGGSPVCALIAPHIDFHRGGPAYAWGYRDLAERCDADLFVIFGTCHAGMPHPFALTRKPYDTPLGAAAVDVDFVERLSARAGQDCFAAEGAPAGDADAFFDDAARDGDARRVCGLSPIWTLLRATGGTPGVLRRYAQTPDPQCVVTFASVVF